MDGLFILKSLSDETRLEIVRFLLAGKKNATKIVQHIKKSQPNTSLALKQLTLSGILSQEKQGREIYYFVTKPKEIVQLMNLIEDLEKR